jgi:hypothetical protein
MRAINEKPNLEHAQKQLPHNQGLTNHAPLDIGWPMSGGLAATNGDGGGGVGLVGRQLFILHGDDLQRGQLRF